MKKILLFAIVLGSLNVAAKAKFSRPYGYAGCGLGSVVMGKDGGQLLAATTNGSTYNQLFGITFGTLNCVDGPGVEVAGNLDKFIVANRAHFEVDVVKGNGETLSAVSQILGCEKNEQFSSTLKSNYGKIFSQPSLKVNEISDNVINVIMDNEQLAQNCHLG